MKTSTDLKNLASKMQRLAYLAVSCTFTEDRKPTGLSSGRVLVLDDSKRLVLSPDTQARYSRIGKPYNIKPVKVLDYRDKNEFWNFMNTVTVEKDKPESVKIEATAQELAKVQSLDAHGFNKLQGIVIALEQIESAIQKQLPSVTA